MADFGFSMSSLTGLGLKVGYMPLITDVYNPFAVNFGNSNLPAIPCDAATQTNNLESMTTTSVDWIS